MGFNKCLEKKKDTRTYKNFKFWPTEKLKSVVDDDYNRGVDGADYQPYIDEIKDVYYLRLNKVSEVNMEREIQARG